jgi:hypothetical protein
VSGAAALASSLALIHSREVPPPIRFLAAGAALLVAVGAEPLAAGSARGWLQLITPAEPESDSLLPLLEVRGQAATRGLRGHDLVIVIDVSDSTTRSSGLDLDADGPDGLTSEERILALAKEQEVGYALLKRIAEIDLEDSVLFAELMAAEQLVARLDLRDVRVGIVTFSDHATVRAPLGTPVRGLRRALDSVRSDFYRDLRGTHFADAIDTALAMLRPPAPPQAESGAGAPQPVVANAREGSILLLSDGAPTLPVHGDRARLFTLEAADRAFAAGVRIYSFALGEVDGETLDVYAGIATRTGGRMERIERPGDAIPRLRRVDLADLAELDVENTTTGQSGRAIRTFPDGSFDGFVILADGVNRLRVTAIASDGRRATADRLVHFRKGEPGGDGQALLQELRRRTRETELWAEVEQGRQVQVRELDLAPGVPDR